MIAKTIEKAEKTSVAEEGDNATNTTAAGSSVGKGTEAGATLMADQAITITDGAFS